MDRPSTSRVYINSTPKRVEENNGSPSSSKLLHKMDQPSSSQKERLIGRHSKPRAPVPDLATIAAATRNSSEKFMEHASQTLGSTGLRDVVKLPHGEDISEWIAMHISDFHNQITMLYGTILEDCTADTCPVMTAGVHYEYYWTNPETNEIISCPAPTYIDYLLSWVKDEMDNEKIFPTRIDVRFPMNFRSIAQTILKRLFRIYAHIYHAHFEYVEHLKAVDHLNTSFKHFMLFVKEFNLIDKKDLEPMSNLIQELVA